MLEWKLNGPTVLGVFAMEWVGVFIIAGGGVQGAAAAFLPGSGIDFRKVSWC
jgi:hypothetical protein